MANQADPVGKNIINLIYILFWFGFVVYVLHFLRLGGEYTSFRLFQNYIKTNNGLGDMSESLLDRLRAAKVYPLTIIYRRIHDLVKIKEKNGAIDHDTLGDIHAGEASRKAGLPTYILGSLIILGLIGTLRGLLLAIADVRPLLQDIQNIDQFPNISEALRRTLAGMGTAFATTVVGLGTSLLLGVGGWSFNLANSSFLTHFERYISTEVLPLFTQTPESFIESNIEQLTKSTETLKVATDENIRAMREGIRQITETSWNEYLETPYLLTLNIKTSSENLAKSLDDIRTYQGQIQTALTSFDTFAKDSIEQISEFKTAVEGYKVFTSNSVETYTAAIKEEMSHFADSQEILKEFMNQTVDKFTESLTQSISQITTYQQALRDGLEKVVPSLQIEREALRIILEEKSSELKEIMEESQNAQARFVDEIAEALQERIKSISDNQQVMVEELQNLASELKIQSALDRQNQVFDGIKTQLINNQNETVGILSQLKDNLQVRDVVEEQNKIFNQIQAHLGGQATLVVEQKEVLQQLNTNVRQLQQTMSKGTSESEQRSVNMLENLSQNFVDLNNKLDVLNATMSKPNLYKWGSEIRNWIPFLRKKV